MLVNLTQLHVHACTPPTSGPSVSRPPAGLPSPSTQPNPVSCAPAQVREAQLAQYNYILVVGEQERVNRTVNVRTRDNVVHGMYRLDELVATLAAERDGRTLESQFKSRAGAGGH